MIMNKLYFAHITKQINQSESETLLSLISTEKQERIKRYRFGIDKKLSLYSELLIRILACKNKNIKNVNIVFDKSVYGKPFLIGYPDFYFNISHTRNAIVVAISDYPIGVDIESIKKAELEIAQNFFCATEFLYITNSKNDMDKRFYEIWTKKEAYLKYIGRGLSLPMNLFDVLSDAIALNMITFEKEDYIISFFSEEQKKSFELIELSEKDIDVMATSVLL